MSRKIQLVQIEVTTIRAYARDAISGAHTQAERLADVARSLTSTLDFYSDPDEIRARATVLRSAALHAAAIASELLAAGAALEQISAFLASAPPAD
jgi:hypothetical protein